MNIKKSSKKTDNLGSILKDQIQNVKPNSEEINRINELIRIFTAELKKELRKKGNDAEVFLGGSFAKHTMVKKDEYDIDIFVRFDYRYDDLSGILGSVLEGLSKRLNMKLEKVHGSRDYFKVYHKLGGYFELIPVSRIKRPKEEKNVTDLSYFHVPYVKRKIKGLEDELRLAKTFCYAQKVYGAETYIRGFSGYALECLIIYYKSFVKMLRELSKIGKGERIVIDLEKKYGKKSDIFVEMNENKLHSPIILIDPTYKERNALAALSHDTFERFQESARKFLKNPGRSYFIEKKIDVNKLRKKAKTRKAEFLHMRIKTDKQAGDIAGTKLKKFSYLIEGEIKRYFSLSGVEFDYDDRHTADIYMVAKSRKEVVRIGPPLHLKKFVRAFKRQHMSTYEKNNLVHARIKVNFGAREFMHSWKKQRANRKLMKEMGITGLRVIDYF